MSEEQSLLIAICAYNEIENLPSLYEALRISFDKASILIVDDNSPDGTGEWCDETARSDDRFFVLHREEKAGLGSASIAGFQYAIENNFNQIMTMDGDWSHNPVQAPNVVQKLRSEDAEIAIGSRYVPGGKIFGWPATRHWMSFCINTYARWMIGLRTKDCSSAFRCYSVDLLKRVNFSKIRGMGYAYLEELLWHAKCHQAKIVEEPIVFTNRIRGKSKINLKEAVRAVWIIFKIGIGRLFGVRP